MSTSYYRIQSADRDATTLLDPEQQWSMSYRPGGDVRHGVSVCESIEDLADYLAHSGVTFEWDWNLVEVTGPLSDERDEDHDLGARLILPDTIVSVEPMTDRLADLIIAAADAA